MSTTLEASSHSGPLRVGVFGGAFDPPHLTHQALARAALAQLELDLLHIVPTGDAWHKTRVLTPKPERLRLAQLAFEAHKLGAPSAQVLIDDRELMREGASYTIQTLSELAQLYPGAQFYLILGQDQALDFIHWKNHAEIPKLCRLAVAKRPGVPQEWHNQSLGDFIELRVPLSPISATTIRERIAANLQATDLLDPDVIQFIQQQGLYSTKT